MREFIEEDRRDEIKTYFHGPMDWPKPPNLFFCLGTLNIPKRVEKVPVVNWRRKMTHRRVLVVMPTRAKNTKWRFFNVSRGTDVVDEMVTP